MRRPIGVEISREDRGLARKALRDPNRMWASPADARDHYANSIAARALRGQEPFGYWLYAFALAARLHDVQTRRDFPPHLMPL